MATAGCGRKISSAVNANREATPDRAAIVSPDIAAPAGPYSHASRVGTTVFLSGHTPRHADNGTIAATLASQARQTLENLTATARAAGGSLADAVAVRVYLHSLDDSEEMDSIYAEYFEAPYPARTVVQANVRGFLIEIDAVLSLR
jgi:2-iminobutanoate/2-iminopropanoate deaminase